MTIQQFLALIEDNESIKIVPPSNLPDPSNTDEIINRIQNHVLQDNFLNSNNSLIDKINTLKDSVAELGRDIHSIVTGVGKVIYYLTHPKVLAWLLWGGLVHYSYIICIIVCLLGIVLYLLGYKKGAKYSKVAFLGYFTIQLFNKLIGGI